MSDREQTRQVRETLQRLVAQDSWEMPYARAANAALDSLLAELEQAEARLAKADKLAEAVRRARSDLWWFIENSDEDEVVSRAMAIQDEVLYPALAEWQGTGAAESIRSTLDKTPANVGVEAPSGLEPLFQSAEPKADR